MGWIPAEVAPATLASERAPLGAARRPGEGSPLSGFLFALGLVILTLTVLAAMRRRMRRTRHDDSLTPRERIERVRERAAGAGGAAEDGGRGRAGGGAAAREAIESLMADSEELTRRLAAILDNKAARLEALVDRAERAAARLERATGAGGDDSEVDRGSTAPAARERTSARPAPAATPDPVSREIYSLADEGLPPVEIARRMEEHIGKVELILALRER